MALALCLVLPGVALAAAPDRTAAERGFAKALDRETQGRFSQLLAARDPVLTIEHFDDLLGAYTRVADSLYAAYSDDSIDFPGWWGDQLVELALGDLSHRDTAQLDFFRQQLESDEFERVVHGYYVLSLNLSALRATGVPVSALREQMVERAKADESDRFWISLWLAESRLLEQPFDAAVRKRTERVNGDESVQEYVGKNAKQLGPRIHRILDLPRDLANDTRVTHYYIREARRAAEDRLRRHRLLAQGSTAGYQSIRRELDEFRGGRTRSHRFQQIIDKDLHDLFREFGLPADPDGMLRLLRAIYREKGELRFDLRVGIDKLAGVYKAQMIAEVGGTPSQTEVARVSVDEMLQLGPDGARAFLLEAFSDATQPERIQTLLGKDMVGKLIESFPPEDPSRLRAAVVAGYASLGHPASLRSNYLAALSALESLAPERAAPMSWSSREVVVLSALFADASDNKAFAKGFRALHRAADSGAFPASAEPPPELVLAIAQSAVRLIQKLDAAQRAAVEELARAERELSAASRDVREAQRAARDHNREIGLANEELVAAEDRIQVAVHKRNGAVETLNKAVSDVNRAGARLRDARARGASAKELESLAGEENAARSRASSLERALDAMIEDAEQAAAQATGEADAAERRALAARDRAQSAQQRGQAAGLRENDAYDERAAARAREDSSTAAILEVLNQSALSLHLIGVTASGDDSNSQLAADDALRRELARLIDARGTE